MSRDDCLCFPSTRSAHVALAVSLTVVLLGCAKVPRQYVKMAEPGVTLTASPENYRGKVVLMGGTIVEEA
jgi:starvation-inducible outer membrane lipoprotein